MSTKITDLLQQGAGPMPAPVDVEALHRRAAQRRRTRRAANVVTLVVIAALVSAPLVWLGGREPTVVLDSSAGGEILGIFEGDPDRVEGPWEVSDTSVWRATQVGEYTIYVSPWGDGSFCIWAASETTRGGGCSGVLTAGFVSSDGVGVGYALVPDGYDTYTTSDGQTFPITNNVIAVHTHQLASQESGPAPDHLLPPGTLSGPAGEHRFDPTDAPETPSDSQLGVVDGPWVTSAAPVGLVRQPAGERADPVTPAGGPLATVDTPVGTISILPGATEVEGMDVGDPLCVANTQPTVGPGVVSCGMTTRMASHNRPYVAAITWPDGGGGTDFAALVPDGWTELRYADGQTVPISDNVLAINDIDQRPVTAMLRHADGTERIVAVTAYPHSDDRPPSGESTEGTTPASPAPSPADDTSDATLDGDELGIADFAGEPRKASSAAALRLATNTANATSDTSVEPISGTRRLHTLADRATSRTDPDPALPGSPPTEPTGPDLATVIWLTVVILAIVGGAVWLGMRIGRAENEIIEEMARQYREDGRPIHPSGTHRWFF